MPAAITVGALGAIAKRARQERALSEKAFGASLTPPIADKVIRAFEQGKTKPADGDLRAICVALDIAPALWMDLLASDSPARATFEALLSELTGRRLNATGLEKADVDALDRVLGELFGSNLSPHQCLDRFNRVLVFYGVPQVSYEFFEKYLTVEAFASVDAFSEPARRFQIHAVRLFSSIARAFARLSQTKTLASDLLPLEPHTVDHFANRSAWDSIEEIPEERLSDLGYISAARIKKERDERTALSAFLHELADKIAMSSPSVLTTYSQPKLRRMDSLLRKFQSTIPHGFLSPLFVPDSDALRREAERIAPKEDVDLKRMELTQQTAMRNLANYLSADFMDVYVATSMRVDTDFISVNRFVSALFAFTPVSSLRLRYFNPTQSWIEDRVAKGLVEALMLRRAMVTIYMAQKDDTFGKDSEASVTLGQGKPVIVYVPRLTLPELKIDSAALGLKSLNELRRIVADEGTDEDKDIDETFDEESLMSRILTLRLDHATDQHLNQIAQNHWADFDLYGEAARLEDESLRRMYRSWLDAVVQAKTSVAFPKLLRVEFIRVVVALATRFERRAKLFREVHPLALQVIISTGVLNGILVARSIEQCGALLRGLIENRLNLALVRDEANYRVIETDTNSTIRVISRNRLLANSFDLFYSTEPSRPA